MEHVFVLQMLLDILDAIPSLDILDEMLEFGLSDILGDMYGPTMTVKVRDLMFDGVKIPCGNKSLNYLGKFFCTALRHYAPTPNLESDQEGNIIVTLLKFVSILIARLVEQHNWRIKSRHLFKTVH